MSGRALTTARALGDPATLGAALSAYHLALFGPGNLAERLAVAAELLHVATEQDDRELAMQAHWWHVTDLLELGDIASLDEELDAWEREAQALRQPRYQWGPAMVRAGRANLAGDIARCEQLANEAYAIGATAIPDTARTYFMGQFYSVQRWKGKLEDLEPVVRLQAETFPTWPVWRCVLAYSYAEINQEPMARHHFDALAANRFDELPFDAGWLMAIGLLADVCAYLADQQRAVLLYDLMLPYAERNVVAGFADVTIASAARCLGVLASCMGRFAIAEAHFNFALNANDKMGARAWAAHTRMDLANMLRKRDAAGDRPRAGHLLDEAAAGIRQPRARPLCCADSCTPG